MTVSMVSLRSVAMGRHVRKENPFFHIVTYKGFNKPIETYYTGNCLVNFCLHFADLRYFADILFDSLSNVNASKGPCLAQIVLTLLYPN